MNDEVASLLQGKQLLLDEIPYDLYQLEKLTLLKRNGVIKQQNGDWFCQRCGNRDKTLFANFPCARCGNVCTYCRKCIMMGRVSCCTDLYSWQGPECLIPPVPLKWSGTLSPAQGHAADRIVSAVEGEEEILVWAVCGAGKTELLFPGIEAAFRQGKRVCIATPRTDVVLELTPRLQKVFPEIKVASLYGGSEDRHTFSPLTMSTTHQLIRFYQAFDVIIVDEVDAFPFTADPSLSFAVQQARKSSSTLVYLTATPSRTWQQECKLGKRNFVTIPARFHRHPLPVPRFAWCGNWSKQLEKGLIPRVVFDWISARLLQKIPILLFVPRISYINPVTKVLRQKLSPAIEGVHSEDPKRKEKVQQLRANQVVMLVTTTILERGVTFPGLDVAVLGADDPIFTESALVQIAGRVGRSPLQPTGDVSFFHNGKTEAMVRARKQIFQMNKEASAKGMLDL